METRKRKRESETGAPRIKYHVEQLGRSFERILKEDSLEELRSIVRKKLKLDDATSLELTQLREGKNYDLEDDDDFEAFKSAAFAFSSLDVRVSFAPQAVPSTAGQTGVTPPTEISTNHGSSEKTKKDSQTKPKSCVSVSEKTTQDANTNQIAHPTMGVATVLADDDDPAPPKKRQKRDGTDSTSRTKRVSKSKDPNIEPNQEQEQEPPKKRQRKSKGTEVNDAIESVPPSAICDTATANQELVQEPQKKRQRKSKGTEVDVAAENFPTSVVPETVPPNQEQEQAPPKKRPRKSKETEVIRDAPTSAAPEAAPKSKRSIKKKASKTEITDTEQKTEQKEGEPQGHEVPPSGASLSAPPALSRHVSASVRDSDSLPQPSTGESAAMDFIKKSTEKLLETLKSKSMLDAKRNGTDSVTSQKAKGKEKSQPKVRPGTSRLRKSWVPEDDVSSISSAEHSALSPSTSAPPHPPSSPSPAPPVLPPTITPLPTVIPSPQVKPLLKPKSSSKQVSSSCPVCLSRPLHLRHLCPVIKGGSSAIKERIKELENEGGDDDLVQELHEWLDKAKIKEKVASKGRTEDDTVSTAGDSPVSKNVLSRAPELNRKRDSRVSVPEWASIVSQDGRVSEVTVESRDEGSEGEESSTSRSGSSHENGKIDGKELGQVDLQSGSESESVSDSESVAGSASGSTPESIAGQRAKSLRVDLEDVDLDALIRGPVVKVQLSRLAEESETDSAEEKESLLEEDEEERPQRGKRRKSRRFSSAEAVSSNENEESEAESVAESLTSGEADMPTGVSRQGSTGITSGSASVEANPILNKKSDLQQKFETEPSPVSAEAIMAGLNIQPSEGSKTQSEEPSDLLQVVLPPTTPGRQPISRATSVVRSPLVGKMKDLPTSISSNPPDNGISTIPPMNETLAPAPGEQAERRERMHSDAPSHAGSTTKSLVMPESTSEPIAPDAAPRRRRRSALSEVAKLELKAIDDANKVQRKAIMDADKAERKRMADAEKAQQKAIADAEKAERKKLADAEKAERKAVADAEKEERRALKAIKDAEKAELKATKEAEKAARAAEKLAKMDEKKTSKKAPAPRNSRRKTSAPMAAASETAATPSRPPTSMPTPAASQWETLPPLDSSVISSSPAVDQLMYSSPAVQLNRSLNVLEGAVRPGGPNGTASPKAISVATSVSRKRDEDDVEEIIGSQKEFHREKTLSAERQRLFLPGASQMTQTQITSHEMDEQIPDVPDDHWVSGTSSDTEVDEGEIQKDPKPSTASRLPFSAKTAFPSLSQLSFDKFRPSFLLPGRGSSQDKTTNPAAQVDDESESDDEDSSDEEHSHIPKGRLAGTGLTKRKSRGLLHG